MAFTLDTEARGLLPFYAILVQLHTFTVLRQNALTFTLPPPYDATRRRINHHEQKRPFTTAVPRARKAPHISPTRHLIVIRANT